MRITFHAWLLGRRHWTSDRRIHVPTLLPAIVATVLAACSDPSAPGRSTAGGGSGAPTTSGGAFGGQSAGAAGRGGAAASGGASAGGGNPSGGAAGSGAGGSVTTGGAAGLAGASVTGGAAGLAGTSATGGAAGSGVSDAGRATDTGARTDALADATVDRTGLPTDGAVPADVRVPPAGCGFKRGVAYGFEVAGAPADVAALGAPQPGISWYYGWAMAPSQQMGTAYAAAGVEFVPMVWGKPAELTDTNLAAKIPAGSRYLLGFNEPNFHSQANLTPAQAAAAWPNLVAAALAKNLELVSPAVNYCGPASVCNQTDPIVWLDQFFAACTGCKVDYIGAHWYACGASAANPWLQNYVTRLKKYGKPIWLTEFACADSPPAGGFTPAQVDAYMRDAVAYLESEPMIFRYAWFSGRTTVIPNVNLLGGSGALTSLGTTYTSLPATGCP